MSRKDELSLSFIRRVLIFTHERFDPLSHFVMIGLFVTCHFFAARLDASPVVCNPASLATMFIGTAAFFFMLRIFDEIKDYAVDLKFNPRRPLSRGLVTVRELKLVMVACIGIELASFAFVSVLGVIAISTAIAYSLLMYKEFFIGRLIRPHLTTYAVSHTFVSALLSLALFSTLHSRLFWQESPNAFCFALATWCLFNIFEFGRKTFATAEERPGVDSYSSIFGRRGAVLLSCAMAGCAAVIIPFMRGAPHPGTSLFLWLCTGALSCIGIAYAGYNRNTIAKVFRRSSSVFIIVVFAGLVILFR